MSPGAREAVIVLHGLARTSRPMQPLAAALRAAGYDAVALDYPSTRAPIETLVAQHLAPAVEQALQRGAPRVHFVGHSMGGILARCYLHGAPPLPAPVRVVMIGTPNGGSEWVDRLGGLALFQWINGPAGQQLGTDAQSLPNRLPDAQGYEAGIIAGTRVLNPMARTLFRGANDGKVSVARAAIPGMRDVRVLPVTHTFMMIDADVIRHTVHFVREGRFASP